KSGGDLAPLVNTGGRIGPFVIEGAGLRVESKPTRAQWERAGNYLSRAAGHLHWLLGDWLNYGEQQWGEMYTEAQEVTGLSYQPLRDLKWVVSRFELSRRQDKLSFKHHAEVAGLPPEQADPILERAVKEKLSAGRVRELVQESRSLPGTEPTEDTREVE